MQSPEAVQDMINSAGGSLSLSYAITDIVKQGKESTAGGSC